eukprot:s436_g20.t2
MFLTSSTLLDLLSTVLLMSGSKEAKFDSRARAVRCCTQLQQAQQESRQITLQEVAFWGCCDWRPILPWECEELVGRRQTFIDPKWDVASLSLLVRSYSASMEFLAETRRYLTDGDMKRMVVEITSPKGTTVKRIFELEPGEGNHGGDAVW